MPRRDWTRASTQELIGDLAHANVKVRLLATNELVDRGGPAVTAAARRLIDRRSATPEQRASGLWILSRLGALPAGTAARRRTRSRGARARARASHPERVALPVRRRSRDRRAGASRREPTRAPDRRRSAGPTSGVERGAAAAGPARGGAGRGHAPAVHGARRHARSSARSRDLRSCARDGMERERLARDRRRGERDLHAGGGAAAAGTSAACDRAARADGPLPPTRRALRAGRRDGAAGGSGAARRAERSRTADRSARGRARRHRRARRGRSGGHARVERSARRTLPEPGVRSGPQGERGDVCAGSRRRASRATFGSAPPSPICSRCSPTRSRSRPHASRRGVPCWRSIGRDISRSSAGR